MIPGKRAVIIKKDIILKADIKTGEILSPLFRLQRGELTYMEAGFRTGPTIRVLLLYRAPGYP